MTNKHVISILIFEACLLPFSCFFLEGGGGWEKGVQPLFILYSQVQTKKKNVNYDTKEIVHKHSPSLSSWKKFFLFLFFFVGKGASTSKIQLCVSNYL